MKNILISIFLLTLPSFSFADHHALSLEARQPRAELEITSIALGAETTVITAETEMGEYGRVFMTFTLSYNNAGDGGTYTFEGRGFVDESTVFGGKGVGVWYRDGALVHMEQLINISDGTQNFDRLVMDGVNRTMSIDVYALK